jgi:hypothetical protein
MKQSKMKTKITIRDNESLKRLSERCNDSIVIVSEFIINKLVEHNLIYLDDTELCGMKLPDLLHENVKTLAWFTNEVFGSELQIWGLGDCPDCGCEMEPKETRTGIGSTWVQCTNCGNEENRGSYYDPDDYRDDCQAELKTFSQN